MQCEARWIYSNRGNLFIVTLTSAKRTQATVNFGLALFLKVSGYVTTNPYKPTLLTKSPLTLRYASSQNHR